MTSTASTAEMRTQIVEGLTGAIGDPKRVTETARALAGRCVASIMNELNEMFSTPVAIECSSVEIARFASSRPSAEAFGAMAIVAANNSPDALLVTIDAEALAIAMCAMFGADEEMPVIPITRPLSEIEIEVAARLFEIIASCFNGSGERSLGVKFPLASPIVGEEIDKQVIRDGPAARVTFELILGESKGLFTVTMPQRVLVEARGDARASSKSGAQWRKRFSEEVMRSAVSLTATVPVSRMTLSQLSHLRVGQVLELGESAPRQSKLSSRDRTLFLCEFGKIGQNYTVRVIEPFDAKRELVEELLTA